VRAVSGFREPAVPLEAVTIEFCPQQI